MLSMTVCQRPVVIPDLQERRIHRHPGLVRGHVIARERVVGPPGQEQHGPIRAGAEVECQPVRFRVPANRAEREVVGIAAVQRCDSGAHIVAVIVDRA